jgi:hypothetical protein
VAWYCEDGESLLVGPANRSVPLLARILALASDCVAYAVAEVAVC